MRLTVTVVVLISLVFSALEASAVDLLPDLFSWDNEAQGYMHDGQFNCIANCAGGNPTYVYRFSVAVPTIGEGTAPG